MYAIIDIETTGGKYNEEGVTEIAIYKFDGHSITDQFISLVNPEKEIQDFVVKLTGINNKMLRNAPKFFEVAKRIIEITEGCTIVAHNASFDYRILRTEFDRLGYDYKRNSICTVELSKQLLSDAPSHSLGKLCRHLGIPVADRHRASGDAMATVQLFKLLLEKDVDKEILANTIKYHDKRTIVRKIQTIIEDAPELMGVFYLHSSEGKVLYLGRGKNIKKELNRIFLKTSKRSLKLQEKIAHFTYEVTGNELLNRLKFYTELETLKPKFNIRKKRRNFKNGPFNHHNLILIDKGRIVEEHAVILIEDNEVLGYTFTNLGYQENNISVLKTMITPIAHKDLAKTIVKNYLEKNKVAKIIRY